MSSNHGDIKCNVKNHNSTTAFQIMQTIVERVCKVVHVPSEFQGDLVEEIERILSDVEQVLQLLSVELSQGLFDSVIVYIERFVQSQGKLNVANLYPILCVAAIVAIKFWEDQPSFDMSVPSDMFGISLKALCAMERNFLQKINYQLMLL